MEIHDTFSVSGTDFKEFLKELDDIVSNTEAINCIGPELTFLSFQLVDKNGNYVFTLLDPMHIKDYNALTTLPQFTLEISDEERPFYEEMKNTSKLVLMDETEKPTQIYLVAQEAISSLADRAGVKGNELQTASLIRNMYIAQGIYSPYREKYEKRELPMIVRQQGQSRFRKAQKIFAFMGSRFVYSSLNTLKTVAQTVMKSKELGAQCRSWRLTHKVSKIFLEFPAMADEYQEKYHLPEKIIPGLCIMDSDIGRHSFTILSTYRPESIPFALTYDAKNWEHTADIKAVDVVNYICSTFLKSFAEIPKSLDQKLQTPLPAAKMFSTYKDMAKEIQLSKSIGKKRTTMLLDHLKAELDTNPEKTPTNEYELAKRFFECVNIIDPIPDYAAEKLAAALGQIPLLARKGLSMKWEI